MEQMRAYILGLGTMQSDANSAAYWGATVATRAQPDTPHRMAVTPSYAVLIHHPEAGWVLYDTGMGDPTQWPRHILDVVLTEKPPETAMKRQLSLLDLTPADIRYVILSHMHMDHIGNDRLFADTAEFFVSREEAGYACRMVMCSQDPSDHGFYIRQDVLLSRRRLRYIDRDEELFPGVEVIQLPGHTPGVMGLVLHLAGGTILFPSDAAAFQKNLEDLQPAGVYDSLGYAQSIRKIRDLQKKYRARVFCSHDPDQLKNEIKLAPYYYE